MFQIGEEVSNLNLYNPHKRLMFSNVSKEKN